MSARPKPNVLTRELAYPFLERAVLTEDPVHPEHSRHAQALLNAKMIIAFVRYNEAYRPRRGRPRGDRLLDGAALIYMAEQVRIGKRLRVAGREALQLGLTSPGNSEEAGIKRLTRKFRERRSELMRMHNQIHETQLT